MEDIFATEFDAEAAAKRLEDELKKLAEEEEGGKQAPRHSVQKDVVNSYMVVPGLGRTLTAWRSLRFHFNPFHICGRKDPIYDTENETYAHDKRFANCPRCLKAWEAFSDARENHPHLEAEAKTHFKKNMDTHGGVIQVVCFTPFMPTGKVTKQTNQLIQAWMEDFVNIVRAVSMGEEYEIPEGMPEDIAYAAECGVGLMRINKTTLDGIRNAHDTDVKYTQRSPFSQPLEKILQITVKDDKSKSFDGYNGQTMVGKTYSVSIENAKALRFTVPPELPQIINSMAKAGRLINIHKLDARDDVAAEDKPAAFVRFTDDEMLEFLDSRSWSPITPSLRPASSIPDAEPAPASIPASGYDGSYNFGNETPVFEDADADDDELPF